MPRNGSGTYTLPASNPVVAGTTIEASWANNTMSDIATELTNSLSRSGAGGMTGPLRLDAGTSSVPGLAWGAETTTGWYRAGTGDIRFAVATVDVLRVQSTGLTLTGALSVSGAATLSGGTANGVLFLDGSKVATSGSALTFDGTNLGIGTASPARKLHLDDASTGALFRISSSTNGSARGIEWWNNPTSNIYGSITSDYTSGVWTYDAGQSVYAGQHVFRIGTGGEAMRLDASGNLGIGTPSPNARLVVQQANNTADGIRLFASGSDTQLITRYVSSVDAWQVTASYASTGAYKPITWWTSDLERMRLDASGNLGLGVVPSASWSSGCRVFQFGNFSAVNENFGGYPEISFNSTQTGSTSFIYRNGTNPATRFSQTNGEFQWFTAPSGTAGNAITFTQAMTLDASGNLGLGTASPGSKLEVYGGAAGTITNAQVGNASTAFLFGVDASNNCQVRTAQNVPMLFYTNATQRMQISADGNVSVGTAALATTATAGFPWIPSCAGIPTGAPTAPYTNAAAMVVDTTNNRLYIRVGSTWRYATLT